MSERELQTIRDQGLAARVKRAIGGVPTLSLVTSPEARARNVIRLRVADLSGDELTERERRILRECRRVNGEEA